ncbi:hypothetical protein G9A89_020539 [Geosiphon pyriformis]|nr:hypothetical protein G9A89_020539 [Geosiphon pyriformis]
MTPQSTFKKLFLVFLVFAFIAINTFAVTAQDNNGPIKSFEQPTTASESQDNLPPRCPREECFTTTKSKDMAYEIVTYFKTDGISSRLWKDREISMIPFSNIKYAKVNQNMYARWTRGNKNFQELFIPVYQKSCRLERDCEATFTGFGVGGVFAVFAALEFKIRFNKNPVVVTFGQPRIGDHSFESFVHTRIKVYRVTYGNDIIPAFPKDKRLVSLRDEYWIPEQDQCDCWDGLIDDKIFYPRVYFCPNSVLNTRTNIKGDNDSQQLKKVLLSHEINFEELNLLSEHAYYAREAACLEDINNRMLLNLYVGILKKIRPYNATLPPELVVFFKSLELSQTELLSPTRKSVKFPTSNDGLVDMQFYNSWPKARQIFWQIFLPYHSDKLYSRSTKSHVSFTGFGHGGVLAIFAGLAFGKKFRKVPTVVTFGQPKIGNQNFIDYVQSRIILYRVTYADDLIPSLPNTPGFPYMNTEYWIPEQEQEECQCMITDSGYNEMFPEVYRCHHQDSLVENLDCNGQYFLKNDNQMNIMPTQIDHHFGPYFGYIMGKCPYYKKNTEKGL